MDKAYTSNNNDDLIITLSGFGPFGNISVNPTMELINSFTQDQIYQNNIRICKVVEVSTVGCNEHVVEISQFGSSQNHIVNIHLGVYSGSQNIQLEEFGYNLTDFSIPDVRGFQGLNQKIDDSLQQDQPLPCGLNLDTIIEELQSKGFKQTLLSNDPGRYICNYIYFKSLLQNQGKSGSTSLFIHVPEFRVISFDDQKRFLVALIQIIKALHDKSELFAQNIQK